MKRKSASKNKTQPIMLHLKIERDNVWSHYKTYEPYKILLREKLSMEFYCVVREIQSAAYCTNFNLIAVHEIMRYSCLTFFRTNSDMEFLPSKLTRKQGKEKHKNYLYQKFNLMFWLFLLNGR
jgi:hypothetical protein